MTKLKSVHRRRNGVLYLRIFVPKSLRGRIGCAELTRSLGTSNPTEAEYRAATTKAGIFRLFRMAAQNPGLGSQELRQIIKRYFDRTLAQAEADSLSRPLRLQEPDFLIDHHDETIDRLSDWIRRNRLSQADEYVQDIADFEGLALKADTDEYRRLAHYALRALVQVQKLSRQRVLGDYRGAIEDPLFAETPKPHAGIEQVAQAVPQVEETATLATIIEAFLREKNRVLRPKTLEKYRAYLTVCADIVGRDTLPTAIGKPTVRKLKDTLAILPANWTKRFPNQSRDEVIAATQAAKIAPMSPASVNAYIGSFSSLLGWAETQGYMEANPANGIRLPDPVRAEDKRDPFTTVQIEAIFSSPTYRGMRSAHHWKQPGPQIIKGTRYWLPLAGLYTGMRLSELLALQSRDVIEEDGIPCFRIRRAKTRAGIRNVPIHPDLFTFGLAEIIPVKPDDLLFGDYQQKAFSKYFRRFLDSVGLTDEKLVFHSLRHTFTDLLRGARIEQPLAKALLGHSDGSVTGQYGRGYPLPVLREAIETIHFPVLDLKREIGREIEAA